MISWLMNNIFLAIIYIIVFKLCAKVQKNIEKKSPFLFLYDKNGLYLGIFIYYDQYFGYNM